MFGVPHVYVRVMIEKHAGSLQVLALNCLMERGPIDVRAFLETLQSKGLVQAAPVEVAQ